MGKSQHNRTRAVQEIEKIFVHIKIIQLYYLLRTFSPRISVAHVTPFAVEFLQLLHHIAHVNQTVCQFELCNTIQYRRVRSFQRNIFHFFYQPTQRKMLHPTFSNVNHCRTVRNSRSFEPLRLCRHPAMIVRTRRQHASQYDNTYRQEREVYLFHGYYKN